MDTSFPRDYAPSNTAASNLLPFAACCLFLLLVSWDWIGYVGSDDAIYWGGGKGWLEHFPYVGGHGSIRETITIPIALSIAFLGNGTGALVLPTLLYTLSLIVLLVGWVNRAAGPTAAVLTAVFLATSPILVSYASVASVDAIESFFIFSSLACFYRAVIRGPSFALLFLSGVLAGLGMLSRETTVFALLCYSLMFLAGFGMPRRWYWVMALGFFCVVGAELAYLWVMTGDPFYRVNISLHHDNDINRWIEQGGGVPVIHPALDPFLALLLSHYFGFLFWVSIPAGVWLLHRGGETLATRRLLQLVGLLSVVWFAAAACAVTMLPLLPRYFMVSAVGAASIGAIALARSWQIGRRRLVAALGFILIAGNLLGLAIENTDYTFGERALVDLASRQHYVIHTDPLTAGRASLLLEWNGTTAKVSTSPPGPGDLYFFNPLPADPRSAHGGGLSSGAAADWVVVERNPPQTRLAVRGLQLLAAELHLPAAIQRALQKGHPGTTLYRVPGPTSHQ